MRLAIIRRNFPALLGAILISILTTGCPSPFTYGITKSTLDAGIRKESVETFQAATKTEGKVIVKYSASVRAPGESDGEIQSRWAVWEIEDLKTKDRPSVSIRSSSIEMKGELLNIVSMNPTLLRSLDDYQRERLASVEGTDLYWIGNGKAKQLSGLDEKEYRLFWGYLAQLSLPVSLIADILTYPIQLLGGVTTCSMSAAPMYRDPRCR